MTNNLQQALDFTDDDLQANRDGKLSPKQRMKLESAQKGSFRALWVMAIITLAALILGVFVGGIVLIMLGTIALLLSIMALVEYLNSYRAYDHDLKLPTIETVQGLLEYMMRENSAFDGMTHPAGIRIGDMKFLLLDDQVLSFEEGEVYVLYYAPATQTLLSAEQVFIHEELGEGELVDWEAWQEEEAQNARH